MYKIVLIVGVFMLGNVDCWTGLIQADPNRVNNDGCETTYDNIGSLSFGEVKRIEGKCAIATCLDNGDISLKGCAPIQVLPPYRLLPGDLSKPFPECCYEIIGPSNETEEETSKTASIKSTTSNLLTDLSINEQSNLI